tara:strand:- start:233 stop:1273 length:1041 start_codon:yes stop_codon:yes gene_type:complete
MAYTTIKNPGLYFNTITYTGDGSNPRTLTGVGFQPNWTWLKNRTDDNGHTLADSVRGANKTLSSDGSGAEVTDKSDGHLDAFTSDGFTVGAGTDDARVNNSGSNYVAWNWLGANGTASNTDGSITSTVSANTTAGFSIVKYTGTGSNATIGHGLGKKPDMLIVKAYEGGQQWAVQHSALGATKGIRINTDAAAYTSSTRWNNTEPTSSVFSVGSEAEVNTSGEDHIAYCFTSIKGYSKFGSYTGNGNADGPFVYTGFKPAFILIKRTDAAEDWWLHDTKRRTFNPYNAQLYANASTAEVTETSEDILSNGFKFRTTNANWNASGGTYIYMAFAEEPLVGDNPATAR